MIVDEAQNLSAEVLEQVRLLTNLETPTQKLLQIILIGQPELRELLDRTDLRQLAQRITGRYHLEPLTGEETKGYVRHRLRVAGASQEIFTPGALVAVHRLAAGIPRVINVTCDRALLGAYTQETRKVSASLVRRAAGEVYGRRFVAPWLGWVAGGLGLACIAGAAFGGWQLWQRQISPLHLFWSDINTHAKSKASPVVAAATPSIPAAPSPVRAAPEPPPININDLLAGKRCLYHRCCRLPPACWRCGAAAMADDKDPCGQAAKSGLACLDQKGSWAQVRALNRPAILTLDR